MDRLLALDDFAVDLHQEIIALAEVEGHETLRPDAFTQYMIDTLIENGELQEGAACFHQARGMEVSGFGIDTDSDTLDLFVTRYEQSVPPASLTRTEIDTAFRRLAGFLKQALEGYHQVLEEASPVFDMCLSIYQARQQLARVRFFLFTDSVARLEYKSEERVGSLPVSYHIWDIQRLQRYLASGLSYEPIRIDFLEELKEVLPCLPAAQLEADYQAYLAILPGRVLSAIYERYGPRLLELNVRSFLQARGKVNQGIRTTIREAPHRFLAYNNGISATAQEVELMPLPDGGQGIRAVRGLQIVNGGQTTASLYNAWKRDKADLSNIFVQAKLTVVGEEGLQQIVPLISRYANSQNTVNEADFSANDRFHVRLEELSRSIWAPATDGTKRQTRWFYERARGQYQDALGREGTPARQRQFKQVHPNAQRFTKTDLAKFANTWDQLPHQVSLGAQKNFVQFMQRLKEGGAFEPDERYFRQLIAKAILFRRVEKIVSDQKFGGYRANIVTYSIAWLVRTTAGRIDLERVWAAQDITPVLEEAIRLVAQEVHASITSPPRGGNVTEWCKKQDCWERVGKLQIPLPNALEEELVPGKAMEQVGTLGADQSNAEERSTIEMAMQIPAEIWLEVSHWAKETGNLQGWQRSLAYSLGRLRGQGRTPSFKQAKQGLLLLGQAEERGYRRSDEAAPEVGTCSAKIESTGGSISHRWSKPAS